MKEKLNYSLGLDVGIASVGWALIERDLQDANRKPKRIINLGVRCFDKPEHPKTGETLSAERRLARGMRRRIKRRASRMKQIKELFIERGLLDTWEQLEDVYNTARDDWKDPWQLRVDALTRILKPYELVQVLTHIAKRRGFKSNRKDDSDLKQDGILINAVNNNSKIMREKGYRTIGEMMFYEYPNHRRNKTDEYVHTVSRRDLENEIKYIFSKQRELGSPFVNEEFETEYIKLWAYQRPFASGDDIINKVGKCSILGEEGEKRAPAACFTSEYFGLLQNINNLRLIKDFVEYSLTDDQRKVLIEKAFQLKEIRYSQVRKYLSLSEEFTFKAYNLKRDKNGNPDEKVRFYAMKHYHQLKSAIESISEKLWMKIANDAKKLDRLAYGLTVYKSDEDIEIFLKENNFDELKEYAKSLPSFSKFKHISIKAMDMIIPYLEKGMVYSDACSAAGLDFKGVKKITKTDKLPWDPSIYEDIRNPVVLRALTQARKVINAIIALYGPPLTVHVELAREVGLTLAERRAILKEQEKNRKTREQIQQTIINETGKLPNGKEILKWRLWKEQGERCVYSGKPITVDMLMDPEACQIDHIIPYSRSMDDSYMNKVLVFTAKNQNKKNLTPYEAWGNTDSWHEFEKWVKASFLPKAKKIRLLKKKFTLEDMENFISRNLNDTRYISRFLKNYLETYMRFSELSPKAPVICVSGRCTAHLRGRWGLAKHRKESDIHHALDAAIIACVDRMLVKRVTEYSKKGELYLVKDEKFPTPYPEFRKELIARLAEEPKKEISKLALSNYGEKEYNDINPIFVSRAPIRKVTGPAHAETIRSALRIHEQISVAKTPIKDIELKDLENMVRNSNGEISDKALYETLKRRLEAHGNKPEKAFATPVYKPRKDGTDGPIVRSIKLETKTTAGVLRNNGKGLSDHQCMVRVDVFRKNNRFFLVPIYVAVLAKRELPNRAIVAGKSYDEWEIMDENSKFLFSLYRNDYLVVNLKNEVREGYYVSCHSRTASITLRPHWSSLEANGYTTGVKLAIIMAKEYALNLKL